ncbi:MAG: hypothetical protein ACKVQR_01270 [Aquabacterium sp.]
MPLRRNDVPMHRALPILRTQVVIVTGVVAALWACVAVASDAAAPAGPVIGPFRLGMNLEEIRAAAPQAGWQDGRRLAHSGRVVAISSTNDITIEGLDFQVQAQTPYYQHGLWLQAAIHATHATDCEQSALAWLARVEAQAGPFHGTAPRSVPGSPASLQWQVQRGAGGSVSVVPAGVSGTPGRTEGATVRVGRQSTVLVEAFDDLYRSRPRKGFFGGEPEHLTISAHQQGPNHRVEVKVDFREAPTLACSVRLKLERWTQPPAPTLFDTSQARLTRQPTIGERHWSTSPQAPVLREPLEVQLLCQIDRLQGQARRCGVVGPAGLNRLHAATATRLAHGLTHDLTGVDRDDPQPMQGTVRVRLLPDDRKPIDFLATPITPTADVVWDDEPDERDMVRAYPAGLSGTPPEVRVALTCRIQADGSLVCGGVELGEVPHRAEFAFAASRVAALGYRAAAKLRDGMPSEGRVIRLTLELLQ